MNWFSWVRRKIGNNSKVEKSCFFLLLFLLAFLAFFPALKSYFYSDDFGLLCISRYIGNPLCFFIQDHFPGSFYYRPLSMFFWWLSYQLFGLNFTLHNLLNLLLHVANAFVFFLLLDGLLGKRRFITFPSSVLFLLHPVSIATSLWLSDRFDLLAVLFILLATYFFLKFLSVHQRKYFIYSISATFLGFLSKEISYVLPVLITLILFTFPDLQTKGEWRKKVIVLLPYYLMTFFLYAMRLLLLRGTEFYFYRGGIIQSLRNGFSNWIRFLPEIYSYHFSVWGTGDLLKYFFILWFLLLVVIVLSSLKRQIAIPWRLFLFGTGLIGISGLVMIPVMNLSTLARPGEEFSFTLLAEGRLYYLSLIGFLTIVSGSLFLATQSLRYRQNHRPFSAVILFPFILISFSYFVSSHSFCQKWTELANGKERQLVELAHRAVQQAKVKREMKIYFLNTQNDSSYFREFADSVLKTIAPEDSIVIHCLFFSEKPPWFNFILKEDIQKIRIAPLLNMKLGGKDFPPLVVGDLTYFYFIFPEGDKIVKDEKAIFLEFLPDEKRFIDVTEKVKSGVKRIRFFNDRPEV